MKPKLKAILEEADSDKLLEILESLCYKYPYLNEEVEFVLSPKKIKNPQSYYNKLVKKAIDTNSWSKFPNKGVKGLELMLTRLEMLARIGNTQEADKIGVAILGIIERCHRNYNSQNNLELENIRRKVERVVEID